MQNDTEHALVCMLDVDGKPAMFIFTEDEMMMAMGMPSSFPEGYWRQCTAAPEIARTLLSMAERAVPALKWKEGGQTARNALVCGWPEPDTGGGNLRYFGKDVWARDIGMIKVSRKALDAQRALRPPPVRYGEVSIEYSNNKVAGARLVVRHMGALERNAPERIRLRYDNMEIREALPHHASEALKKYILTNEDWRLCMHSVIPDLLEIATKRVKSENAWCVRALIPNTVSLVFDKSGELIELPT